jgi:hypothetical protein
MILNKEMWLAWLQEDLYRGYLSAMQYVFVWYVLLNIWYVRGGQWSYDDREDITDDKNHKYKVYTSMYTIYIVYINVKH